MSTLFDATQQARDAGAAVIDEPIINGPFNEPDLFWDTVNWETHEQKSPERKQGRRPAGYFYNPRGMKGEASLVEEEFVELHCVNEIRQRVREWREGGYAGVTPVTRRLVEHWQTGRTNRLFFANARQRKH